MRERRSDEGITLIETLVSIVLVAIVSSMGLAAVVASSRALRHNDDETTGLSDVRKAAERLGRDVRDARSVATGATSSQLVLWIDYNSDYRQTDDETITWKLRAGTQAGHYDVIRQATGGTEVVEANSLVSNLAFTYNLTAPKTTVVTSNMTYDAYLNGGTTTRTVTFVERLRNVDSE